MTKILLIGATSGMMHEIGRIYAKQGAQLYLLARNEEKLTAIRNDLNVMGASQIEAAALDFCDVYRLETEIKLAFGAFSGFDVVVVGHGDLTNQKRAFSDPEYLVQQVHTNLTSFFIALNAAGNLLKVQKQGVLAGISSVAGDRGRQSNFVYGSCKAGVTAFLSGLRGHLLPHGVHVLTIKPGFVATAMTAKLKQGPLFAPASKAAQCIVKAVEHKKDIAYVPGFWALIMAIVIHIPETIFKRLKL